MRVATSSSTRRFGAVTVLPLAARAQQGDRVRRIGVLMTIAGSDADSLARVAAFQQSLAKLDWMLGRKRCFGVSTGLVAD